MLLRINKENQSGVFAGLYGGMTFDEIIAILNPINDLLIDKVGDDGLEKMVGRLIECAKGVTPKMNRITKHDIYGVVSIYINPQARDMMCLGHRKVWQDEVIIRNWGQFPFIKVGHARLSKEEVEAFAISQGYRNAEHLARKLVPNEMDTWLGKSINWKR